MIAVLLPSYERIDDLTRVLEGTFLPDTAKFIVVANYDQEVFDSLLGKYSDRAIFINERIHGKLGVCKAYNLAYEYALKNSYEYAILFADDVLPGNKDWLDQVDQMIVHPKKSFGIFSSDECHFGHFGWNILKDTPIAHFFIIKCGLLGDKLFDEKYKQYVIDFDISVKVLSSGNEITLLPIQIKHYRSLLHRQEMGKNYEIDKNLFVESNPEYIGWFESQEKQRYISDDGKMRSLPLGDLQKHLVPWPITRQITWGGVLSQSRVFAGRVKRRVIRKG